MKNPIQGQFFCSFSAKHKKSVSILVRAPSLWSLNDTIVSLSTLALKGLSACSVSLCLDNLIFIWFISVVTKQCNYCNYYHYFLLFKHPIFLKRLPFFCCYSCKDCIHYCSFQTGYLTFHAKKACKENTSFCAKNEGIFCLSLATV